MWQALRMTAAAAVTFALGSVLGLSQGFWAVIAAVIVTQSSIGGSLKAALEQFTGSLCGAVYGAAVAFAIPHQTPAALGLALVIAVGPLAVLATYSPGFRIAPITAIIVLLSTIGVTLGPVGFAVERVLEVALGCAVGLAVSVLLVPAPAVGGRWCYLYRAIDRSGAPVDVMSSEHRDMAAAKAFFRSAKAATGVTPEWATTDGHDSYPRAIRSVPGRGVRHRTSRYPNDRLEQDHRGIKGRYRPMRSFKCPRSDARFCRSHDEL
jgi:uncharacterized membrane protein YccC